MRLPGGAGEDDGVKLNRRSILTRSLGVTSLAIALAPSLPAGARMEQKRIDGDSVIVLTGNVSMADFDRFRDAVRHHYWSTYGPMAKLPLVACLPDSMTLTVMERERMREMLG